jgi:RNA polymerase sigma factor (sigma-70 family)
VPSPDYHTVKAGEVNADLPVGALLPARQVSYNKASEGGAQVVSMGRAVDRKQSTRQVGASDSKQRGALLEEAFARHQARLLGLLYYLVGSEEDARDAFQEAFVKCWRRQDSAADAGNLPGWIFRVALNVARDMRSSALRRRGRPLADDDARPVASLAPGAGLTSQDQLEMVRRAVLALCPEEKEVLLLRQNGQMTHEEIAAATNAPLETVKTRMRLALTRLREALEVKG